MTAEQPLVLVVEDNAADASLLTDLLEEIRPEVSTVLCSTGEKALAWIETQGRASHPQHPRLLIMDYRLPGRSGLEILTVLRRDPTTRHLPVVILSTSDAQRDVDACYEAGAHAYLVKDSDPDTLGQRVTLAVQLFCHAARPPSRPLSNPEEP